MGMELSPEVEAQTPKVINLVKEEVLATLDGYRSQLSP
jgi:hypothetical protein